MEGKNKCQGFWEEKFRRTYLGKRKEEELANNRGSRFWEGIVSYQEKIRFQIPNEETLLNRKALAVSKVAIKSRKMKIKVWPFDPATKNFTVSLSGEV